MNLPQLNAPVSEDTLGHCFACGEDNPIGLKLKPRYDGEKVTAQRLAMTRRKAATTVASNWPPASRSMNPTTVA